MNLLLLHDYEVDERGEAVLTGRRLLHAREVLRAQEGESIRVGVLRAQLGTATVLKIDAAELRLKVDLTESPPPRANLDILLAIPRPKQLKRVIPALTSLGVDRIVLVNAARVEKSYFDSKVLNDEFLNELTIQGLEQSRDTVPPQILIRDRFKPFVEDESKALFGDARRLLPHPPGQKSLTELTPTNSRLVLAIGPEGGWVPFEISLLEAHGFETFSLGPRILRTEAAVSYLVGQAQLWRTGVHGT